MKKKRNHYHWETRISNKDKKIVCMIPYFDRARRNIKKPSKEKPKSFKLLNLTTRRLEEMCISTNDDDLKIINVSKSNMNDALQHLYHNNLLRLSTTKLHKNNTIKLYLIQKHFIIKNQQ